MPQHCHWFAIVHWQPFLISLVFIRAQLFIFFGRVTSPLGCLLFFKVTSIFPSMSQVLLAIDDIFAVLFLFGSMSFFGLFKTDTFFVSVGFTCFFLLHQSFHFNNDLPKISKLKSIPLRCQLILTLIFQNWPWMLLIFPLLLFF